MTDILLNLAKETALRAAREVLVIYDSTDIQVDTKSDNSPVTEADLKSESVIKENLEESGIKILSEEGVDDGARKEKDTLWIVDPLDGTSDFIKKTDDFSIMIGLIEKGEVVLGVVCAPAKNKIFYATKDGGAFVENFGGNNKSELRVSEVSNLLDARPVFSRFHLGEKEQELLSKIGINEYNKMGSSGLKICSISEGRSDFYITFTDKMSEWDVCAAEIILKEAGGRVTDIKGNDLSYNKQSTKLENGVLASNNLIHEKIISEIE